MSLSNLPPPVPVQALPTAVSKAVPKAVPAPRSGLVGLRLPLSALAVALAGAAALLAGLLCWGLSLWLGAAAWQAPLAAILGVVAATLPTALWLQRVTGAMRGGAASPGALHGPVGTTRELFMELSGREWARSRRYGSGAALLLVDVDRFARLAEARGGAATDAVLAEMLRQTAPTLRGADLLTRFSDSQMAVFLAHADPTGALDVAERIRERSEQLEVPFHEESAPRRVRVTVSIGVAQLRPAHLNLQALIDDAQDAVLAARQAGGNCVRAAPVDLNRLRSSGSWRDDHRARPH